MTEVELIENIQATLDAGRPVYISVALQKITDDMSTTTTVKHRWEIFSSFFSNTRFWLERKEPTYILKKVNSVTDAIQSVKNQYIYPVLNIIQIS